MDKNGAEGLLPTVNRKYRRPSQLFNDWLRCKKANCSTENSEAIQLISFKLNDNKGIQSYPPSWSVYKSIRNLLPFKVVHAEVESASASPTFEITEEIIDEFFAKDTGMDRLRRMFNKTPMDKTHPDLEFVGNIAVNAAIFGFVITSMRGAREAREDFISRNKATTFASRFQANRKLNEAMWMGMVRYGGKSAVALSFFVGLYILIAHTIAAYRNKTSPMEYTVAGGVCGAIHRLNYGPKGMVAGGLVGTIFGLVAGILFYGVMKVTDFTQEKKSREFIKEYIIYERNLERLGMKPSYSRKERIYCE